RRGGPGRFRLPGLGAVLLHAVDLRQEAGGLLVAVVGGKLEIPLGALAGGFAVLLIHGQVAAAQPVVALAVLLAGGLEERKDRLAVAALVEERPALGDILRRGLLFLFSKQSHGTPSCARNARFSTPHYNRGGGGAQGKTGFSPPKY